MSLRIGLRSLLADLKRIWEHPIGSNLIAAGILFVLGSLSLLFQSALNSISPSLGLYAVGIIGVLLVGFLALVLWRYSLPQPKTLVFLSSGGTCRDPMAKAIATKLFEKYRPKVRVIIRAAGLGPISKPEASHAARTAIKEIYGEDVLAEHKPELLTEKIATEADLILVMDRSLLEARKTSPKGWPKAYPGKVYLLKNFFNLEGDVVDPWPDGKDEGALSRYRKCAVELREMLSNKFDQLTKALNV